MTHETGEGDNGTVHALVFNEPVDPEGAGPRGVAPDGGRPEPDVQHLEQFRGHAVPERLRHLLPGDRELQALHLPHLLRIPDGGERRPFVTHRVNEAALHARDPREALGQLRGPDAGGRPVHSHDHRFPGHRLLGSVRCGNFGQGL